VYDEVFLPFYREGCSDISLLEGYVFIRNLRPTDVLRVCRAAVLDTCLSHKDYEMYADELINSYEEQLDALINVEVATGDRV